MLADIIPGDVYGAMPSWLLWLFLGVALRFLAYGADRLVSGAVRLAGTLGISTVIIGATVVSLGTTAPEAFVSVSAAFRGNPGLALGNAVGSIICDTALVFGLCCVLIRLPLDRFVLHRQGTLKLATGGLLVATVFGLALRAGGLGGVTLPRFVGAAYLVLLAGYMYVSVRWTRARPEILPEEVREVGPPKRYRFGSGMVDLLMILDGLAIVYVTSDLLIGSVTVLCKRYHVPDDVMAATVVAFGTSLPELVTALAAIAKGHPELLIGNVIGADILNVLFVVGASAAAVPLAVPTTFFYLHLPVMAAAVTFMGLCIFLTRGDRFRRWQGLPLLALYVAYCLVLAQLYAAGG